jgi:hypothetical protein
VTDRPLLLLDIDGVLNPWAAATCPEGFSEHILFPKDDEPHRFSELHGEWIRDLDRSFEVVWASAWGMVANRLLAPILAIPAFQWVPFPPTPFPPATKVPAIATFVGNRPTAWVDDGLGPDAWEWASRRPAPTLLLPIDPAVGLRLEDVAQLESWRDGLAVSAGE